MARYSVGVTKTTTAAAGLIAQLRPPAGGDARVVEVGVFAESAAAGVVGLVRATNVGATFTSTTPQAEDPKSGATTVALDTAATTAPTPATVPLRRVALPATIGAGVVWQWQPDRGIFVPSSAGLLLWQYSTAIVTYGVYLVFED